METKDRKVIEILLKIGSIVGVTPISSLSKIDSIRNKSFTVLQLVLSTTICTSSIYFNARDSYVNMSKMDMFVDLLPLVFNAMQGVVIITGPLFYSTSWQKLLTALQNNKQLIDYKKSNHIKKEETARVYAELILFHIMFIARFSWDALVWISCRGFYIYKNYLYRMYHEYCAIIAIFLMIHFNLVIQNYFRLLNNILRCTITNYRSQKRNDRRMVCALCTDIFNASHEFRNVQTAYRKLSKMISHFNTIFGYQILFLMGYTVAVTLGSLHNTTRYNNFREKIDVMILSWGIISSTIIVVCIVIFLKHLL